ncbi:TIGR02270 family protein [Sorangium sp. So ce429]
MSLPAPKDAVAGIEFPPLLLDVVEEHASEAAFLWSLRDGAARSPACDLGSLGRLDERLEAHLDGLRLAGEAGLHLCEKALDARDAGAFFAATVVALERADMAAVARILARGARSAPLARGVVSALGWIPFTGAARMLPELWSSACPSELRYLGIAGAAAHRRDPGAPLLDAIASDDTRLKARALRAAGELGLSSALPALRQELDVARGPCRLWAAWSAAILGDADAVEVLWEIADAGGAGAEVAWCMAVRGAAGATRHRRRLEHLSDAPRASLMATAALGDPVFLPWVIERMDPPETARLAGWAFSMLTGVDLAAAGLSRSLRSGPSVGGPTEDPLDDNVALDPDAGLPWPDAARARSWCEHNGAGLRPGVRHLLGRPLAAAWLEQVLRGGRQPARVAAAIELRLLRRHGPVFEVRAPAHRQRHALSTA